MRQFLQASQENIEGLEAVLRSGNHFRAQAEFPSTFAPARGEVVFEHAPYGFVLHFLPDGLSYSGSDPRLTAVVQDARVDASTLRELFDFIDRHVAAEFRQDSRRRQPASKGGRRPGAGPEPVLTDLARAQELLDGQDDEGVLDAAELQACLRSQILEQDDSLDLLAKHLANFSARRTFRRPATVLLLGPTGTGKTQTAEALAAALSSGPHPYEYVRIDFNELNLQHQSARLTGAPPGFVGYGDVPELVRAVRRNPRVLVLLDEMEKGHPELLQVLMNLMASGRLSTAGPGNQGGQADDFSRCILLFTSNLASAELERLKDSASDPGSPAFQDRVRAQLVQQGMPPEIAGRFQLFLIYNRLAAAGMLRIVSLHIGTTAADYGLEVVSAEPAVVAAITSQVMRSPAQARGVCQGIEHVLAGPLARFRRDHPDETKVRIDGSGLEDLRVSAVAGEDF